MRNLQSAMLGWFGLLLPLLILPGSTAYTPQGFIRVCGGKFADGKGKQWTFAGWNGYTDLMNQAYDHLYGGKADAVDQKFREAKTAGLTAVRIWGHGDGSDRVLQPRQGKYDEKVFKSLDYVMFKAKQYNIRVLISLTTFWQDKDGIIAFARWASLTYPVTKQTPYYIEQWDAKDKFWTNPKAQAFYKQHMKAMFSRKNTFNNVRYMDDETIFAWNLFNEPRCPASQKGEPCKGRLNNWANMMFKFAKANNKKQLFSFGEEGFFAKGGQPGSKQWYEGCNPSGVPDNVEAGWASRVGQDFVSQNRNGDFMQFHLWPTNWYTPSPAFAQKWIQCHMTLCDRLKLPCVLGEFGRELPNLEGDAKAIATVRDPYFSAVYKETEKQIAQNKSFGGDMFWQWVAKDAPPRIMNSVRSQHSTFQKLVKPHASFVNRVGNGRQLCPAI